MVQEPSNSMQVSRGHLHTGGVAHHDHNVDKNIPNSNLEIKIAAIALAAFAFIAAVLLTPITIKFIVVAVVIGATASVLLFLGTIMGKDPTVPAETDAAEKSRIESNIKEIFKKPDDVIKIMSAPNFKKDAKKIHDILLNPKLSNIEKLDKYSESYAELIKIYIKKDVSEIAPDELNGLNFAILYSNQSNVDSIFTAIKQFMDNYGELTQSKINTQKELLICGNREAAILKLESSRDLYQKVIACIKPVES